MWFYVLSFATASLRASINQGIDVEQLWSTTKISGDKRGDREQQI